MKVIASKRIRKLGAGARGEVWLVEHEGRPEAHKLLVDVRDPDDVVLRNALHIGNLGHPHVAQIYGTGLADGATALRMEYVEGRNLSALVEAEGILPVEELLPLALQVADGLDAIHERGLSHGAVKPSNLILADDGGRAVLTDGGLSAALRARDGEMRGDTAFFLAPEDFTGRSTPAADIWSFGVTLYYLLSLDLPFPFDEMRPDQAVREPPHDLSASHLHVSPHLWAILLKTLQPDARQRYSSIRELRTDLEIYASSLVCPTCHNAYRFESVEQTCPDPACQSPRVGPYKEALLARRGAETALARCDFERAREGFRRAAAAFGRAETIEEEQCDVERAERLESVEEELRERLAEPAEELRQERYINSVHALQKVRTRFSHAAPVKELRLEIAAQLRELHDGAEDFVQESLRDHDFRAARHRLTRLDHVLADRYARRDLTTALGHEPRVFRDLYEEVERKELAFNGYIADVRAAILEFDFKRALRIYETIETEFPSDKNVPMLERLRRGPGAYSYGMHYPDHVLKAVAADPGILARSRKIRLKKVHAACRRLLDDFSPAEYPTFEKVQQHCDLARAAIDATVIYVNDRLTEAQNAEDENLVFLELKLLGAIENIVRRSDLFDVGTRQHVVKRLRELEAQKRKAELLYVQGCDAFRTQAYVTAQAAFEEIQKLIPEGYRDTSDLLEKIRAKREQLGALRAEVAYELAEIERKRFTPESAIHTLGRAEELYALADETRRRKLLGRLTTACTGLFDFETRQTLAQQDERFPGQLASRIVPAIRTMQEERWHALLGMSPDLCRALCTLLARGYAGGSGLSRDLDVEMERAESVCGQLREVGGVLRALTPPLGSTHPAREIAVHVTRAFERARHSNQERHVLGAIAVLKQAAGFAPPGETPYLREQVELLGSWASRRRKRVLIIVAAVVFVALVAGGVAWRFLVRG